MELNVTCNTQSSAVFETVGLFQGCQDLVLHGEWAPYFNLDGLPRAADRKFGPRDWHEVCGPFAVVSWMWALELTFGPH